MPLPKIKLYFLSLSLVCSSLFAAPISTVLSSLTVDVTGIQSYDSFGASGNTVLYFYVGANTSVTSFSYDIQLTAHSRSWLSDIKLLFSGSSVDAGVIFSPGETDNFSGTKAYAEPDIDLTSLDLAFEVLSDGILRLEFYESFDDLSASADGNWNAGTLTFGLATNAVPEPDSHVLVGLALLLAVINVRRRHGGV